MLHKCANPSCLNQFRRLREGRLFQVETDASYSLQGSSTHSGRTQRRIEYFWLCDQCAPYITLAFDQQAGVITMPLPDSAGQKVITMLERSSEKRTSESEKEELLTAVSES